MFLRKAGEPVWHTWYSPSCYSCLSLRCHKGRVIYIRKNSKNNCNIIGIIFLPDWHCHTMFVTGGMGVATTICNQVSKWNRINEMNRMRAVYLNTRQITPGNGQFCKFVIYRKPSPSPMLMAQNLWKYVNLTTVYHLCPATSLIGWAQA